jgi:hypothetical protein
MCFSFQAVAEGSRAGSFVPSRLLPIAAVSLWFGRHQRAAKHNATLNLSIFEPHFNCTSWLLFLNLYLRQSHPLPLPASLPAAFRSLANGFTT